MQAGAGNNGSMVAVACDIVDGARKHRRLRRSEGKIGDRGTCMYHHDGKWWLVSAAVQFSWRNMRVWERRSIGDELRTAVNERESTNIRQQVSQQTLKDGCNFQAERHQAARPRTISFGRTLSRKVSLELPLALILPSPMASPSACTCFHSLMMRRIEGLFWVNTWLPV